MTLDVTKYPELQALVLSGQEVKLEYNGEVIAKVTPRVAQTARGVPIGGLLKGKIRIAPDFDQTPQQIIDLFEGRNSE